MDRAESNYCRFCAEPRDEDKLFDLKMDTEICQATVSKLTFLNAMYVDISDDTLPKTICFVCYNSLTHAYDFLNKVKQAQDVISNLYSVKKNPCFNFGTDDKLDKVSFDELINDDVETHIKQETSGIKKRKASTTDSKVSVKVEPKEELETYGPTDDTSSMGRSPSPSNFDDSLNVQDIIDAAMSGGPFTSNIAIYAKEMSDVSKKVINTWQEYPWLCAHCNIEFQDIATLRKHSKLVHRKCSAFTCVDCKSYGHKSFNAFVNHVIKHRKSLLNQCYYCDAAPVELSPHLASHFKSHLACPACGDFLRTEEALQQHLLDYNSSKPKRKPRRKRGVPITIADLTCNICEKVYKNPNSLRDHIKLHRSDRKRDYTCDRCGKTFYSKGTLTSHIMSHDQIRPHICRICNKSFLFPNMLRRHVQMHSGVKPYSCEQCGRCFRLQYQLNAHKIIHTDAMPHVCQYCNKAFRFKQILKNHERQHTGAKPYSCKHCGMEFTNWSNYNKHMKRRHGTDTSKKKITPEGVFPINPETGQILQVQDAGMDEWKNKIMIPAKRGKKKVIKREDDEIRPAHFESADACESERDDSKYSGVQYVQNADVNDLAP
ncbi:putative zinc finger protein 66 [Cydia fagiglandana]|uniref:putative zinc finger protein 66 n=1 Tax=Cydia fagiglandana TaxID=1458189 RepID=UPI002FEE3D01